MISAIKRWLYRRAIASHPNVNFKFDSNVNEGLTILLIGAYDQHKAINKYMDELRKLGKHPSSLLYAGKVEEIQNNTYIDKEINWAGIPKSENIEKRIAQKYDICMFLDFKLNVHYKYILDLAKAQFFIGPKVNGIKNNLDLIIDTGDSTDVSSLIQSIKANLSTLSVKL